jgi:YVTN family beta-propeller protein
MRKLRAMCFLWVITSPAWADKIYISLEKDNALVVIDGSSGTIQKSIPVGRHPKGVALSPDAAQLYIANNLWC